MATEIQEDKSHHSDEVISTNSSLGPQAIADPQVKTSRSYTKRRSFNRAYKTQTLAAYDACETACARGELLRREGLYYSSIAAWRKEQSSGKNTHQKISKNTTRVDSLARENEQLKRKLAQAEAIIDLQKKVSELFGEHIRPPMMSDKN